MSGSPTLTFSHTQPLSLLETHSNTLLCISLSYSLSRFIILSLSPSAAQTNSWEPLDAAGNVKSYGIMEQVRFSLALSLWFSVSGSAPPYGIME